MKYGKVPPGFGGFNRLVAGDSLLDFGWREEEAGRVLISAPRINTVLKPPTLFWYLFWRQKSTSPGSKDYRRA
jgi:hypothetical protein